MDSLAKRKTEARIPELDGVRAIAIWMVLLMHMITAYPNPPGSLRWIPGPVMQLLKHGWLGVDLFFILSGFLITGILLDTKGQPGYFRNFYVRRFLRIMPLYFMVVLVWACLYRGYWRYFCLSSIFGANLAPLLGIQVPHGPGVLWSLAVEEHFYLVWPLLVLLLSRRGVLVLASLIFVTCPILRFVYASRGMNPEVIYALSWFRFDGLAAGAILALWARSWMSGRPQARLLACVLLVVLATLSVAGMRFGIFGTKTPLAVSLRYTQAYLGFGALFVLILAYRASLWTAPLRYTFMQWTGALSYCLYLIHLSLGDAYQYLYSHQALIRLHGPAVTVVRSTVVVAGSFATASISQKYLEQPFLAMKDRFTLRVPTLQEMKQPVDSIRFERDEPNQQFG